MQQYLDALRKIMEQKKIRKDRTGTGTKGLMGVHLRFDLTEGFPLETTKFVPFRVILIELLWFISGATNIKFLVDHDVHIWDEWPYKHYLQAQGKTVPPTNSAEWKSGLKAFIAQIKADDEFAAKWGDLGPVYGHQWRHWPDGKGGEIDQLRLSVDLLKNKEKRYSRRNIVSAWNVADIEEMAVAGLPPCHLMYQFYVEPGENGEADKLSCHLTQRSADMFLGVPFNIASYALLTMMTAQVTGMEPGELVMELVDAHIYTNHFGQVEEQLRRGPYELPTVKLNPDVTDLFAFTIEDFELIGYRHHERITAPVAV